MTCQAFLSLSLDPHSWHSRLESIYHIPAIADVLPVSISILAHDQSALALRFADAKADKWSRPRGLRASTGSPLIDGAVASLE